MGKAASRIRKRAGNVPSAPRSHHLTLRQRAQRLKDERPKAPQVQRKRPQIVSEGYTIQECVKDLIRQRSLAVTIRRHTDPLGSSNGSTHDGTQGFTRNPPFTESEKSLILGHAKLFSGGTMKSWEAFSDLFMFYRTAEEYQTWYGRNKPVAGNPVPNYTQHKARAFLTFVKNQYHNNPDLEGNLRYQRFKKRESVDV